MMAIEEKTLGASLMSSVIMAVLLIGIAMLLLSSVYILDKINTKNGGKPVLAKNQEDDF